MEELPCIKNLKGYLKREERRWTLASVQAKKLKEVELVAVYQLNAKELRTVYHQLFKED